MRHLSALALAGLLPLAAQAQTPLDAAGFNARTLGRTILFSVEGETYGGEEYLPGQRVRWSFLDGRCKAGRWFEVTGEICFVYEDDPTPRCWRFYDDDGQLAAEFSADPEGSRRYETMLSAVPLSCAGPDLGV